MKKLSAIILALVIVLAVIPIGAATYAATSVTLNKSSITMGVGETYTLTASGSTSYTWSSSAKTKATVSSKGKITAKAVGTATITVKGKNGKTATCKVTVKKAPTSIKFNKSSITIGVGETYDFSAPVNSGAATYKRTYTSGNKSIATINSSGLVTGKSAGTVTLTVKAFNGVKGTCKVTVRKAPTKVTLNKTSITMGVGETYDLSSTVGTGYASYSRKYTTSKSSVATVSSSGGLITAKAVGTATITVKTFNGKTDTCKVTVKKAPTSIAFNKSTITIGVGETYDFSTPVNSGAATYKRTYTSGNKSIATINSSGLITGKSVGTVTMTVKAFNDVKGTCKVTVKKAPTSIKLNKTSITMGVGEIYDLSSTANSGEGSYKRTYTTSKSSVATVSSSGGLITAKAAGTATITVKTYNGKTATCKVTVKKAPTSIKLNETNVILEIGETCDLTSTVNSGAGSYKRTYTTSKSSVATVSSSGGLITAKSAGTATITVKTFNGVKATCKVTVIGATSKKYIQVTSARIYEQPDSESDGVSLPYMTELEYIGNQATYESGSWDMYKYNNKLYYMWTATGDCKVTDTKSTFTYSASTQYENAVLAEAMRVLNTKTQYIHGTVGDLVPGTTDTYSYDCSGFVSAVTDKAMNPYVPLYNISANLQTLYYNTDAIYNGGTDAAFYATDIIKKGEPIDLDKLRPGDLIFFWLDEEANETNRTEESTHVGLYLGNGEFMHSSNHWNRVIIMPLSGMYQDGFVKASRMLPETVERVNAVRYTERTDVALRSTMEDVNSNIIKNLKIEQPVTVLFISSTLNWAYVDVDGTKGYVATSNLVTLPDEINTTAYSIGVSTRLRPRDNFDNYIDVPCLTEVKLQRKVGNYYRVTYNNKDYYAYLDGKDISKIFTTDKDSLLSNGTKAMVTTTTNFRSTPSSDENNIISRVSAGTEVEIFATSEYGTWVYVRIGNQYGYLSTDYLVSPVPENQNIAAYAIGTTTKLRESTLTDSNYIEINCMEQVLLQKQINENYYMVTYQRQNYYVYLDGETIDSLFTTDYDVLNEGIRTTTLKSSTNLRSTPNSSNSDNVISYLSKESSVTVISVSSSGTWSFIKCGELYGYVISTSLN